MRMPFMVFLTHCLLVWSCAMGQAADSVTGPSTITNNSDSAQQYRFGTLPAEAAGQRTGEAAISPAPANLNDVSASHGRMDAAGNTATAASNATTSGSTKNSGRSLKYAGRSVARSGASKGFSASAEKGTMGQVHAETTKAQPLRTAVVHDDSSKLRGYEEKRLKRKEAFKTSLEKSEKRRQILEKSRRKTGAPSR